MQSEVDSDGEVVCQWLGDGFAAYPMGGLPYMDTDNICAMFDISEKKQEKLAFRQEKAPENVNWDDVDLSERQLDDPMLCVRHECRELLPLRTSEGITFVQEKYLAPLDNQDYMHLYERRDKGGRVYIVAKVGMMIQAVIMPIDVVDEGFVDQMAELTEMCRVVLVKKGRMKIERPETVDEGQGSMFRESGSAGEGAEE